MASDTLSRVAEEVLVHGLDDWVHMPEVRAIVIALHPEADEVQIKDAAISALEELIGQGLVDVGTVTTTGFVSSGEAAEDALRRIERSWSVAQPPANPGEICWLRNTAAGQRISRQAFTRRSIE